MQASFQEEGKESRLKGEDDEKRGKSQSR